MEMPRWLARVIVSGLATVAVFFAIPEGIHDILRGHHYFVIVPLIMWIIAPALLLFVAWFRPETWPPRSK